MSSPVVTHHTPQKTVIGDNTTGLSRLKVRVAKWRTLAILIVSVLVFGFLISVIRPGGSTVPMHPNNAEPGGAMAVTQILKNHGVKIRQTGSASQAASWANSNTTVFIYDTFVVDSQLYKNMLDRGANLVIVEPTSNTINELDIPITSATQKHGNDAYDLVPANCESEHAQAANQVWGGTSGFELTDGSDATLCFSRDEVGPYAESADGRVSLFAKPTFFTNENLAVGGHAALTLRALGQRENVVWLIPSLSQNSAFDDDEEVSMFDFLPPWFNAVFILFVFAALTIAIWRGRRMGRLVTEPLPVVVRGAESTVGLGNMYRRSAAVSHAGDALRAGTALRCAQRLGVAPTASGKEVTSAIAHAINRPYEEVAALLLGGSPRTETDLIDLAQQLDRLESEVHSS